MANNRKTYPVGPSAIALPLDVGVPKSKYERYHKNTVVPKMYKKMNVPSKTLSKKNPTVVTEQSMNETGAIKAYEFLLKT